jgi:hypothetical protein
LKRLQGFGRSQNEDFRYGNESRYSYEQNFFADISILAGRASSTKHSICVAAISFKKEMAMKKHSTSIGLFLVCLAIIAGCANDGTSGNYTGDSEVVFPSDPSPVISTPVETTFPTNHSVSTSVMEEKTIFPNTVLTNSIDLSSLAPFIAENPQSLADENVYFSFADTGSYAYLPLIHSENEEWLSSENILRSEVTIGLSFANHHNLISYITAENEVMIADLSNRHIVRVMTLGSNRSPSNPRLTWTPDDMHLLIDPDLNTGEKYVLHLVDGRLEQWDYQCDQLLLSPRTARVAVLCGSPDRSTSAVIEWGGEIWYGGPFTEIIVSAYRAGEDEKALFTAFPLYYNVGWSSDGETIAFYSPDDPLGSMKIIDSHGAILNQKIGTAYWLSEHSTQVWTLPGKPIQWARNGARILFFGVGDQDYPCLNPSVSNDIRGTGGDDRACWQVWDINANAVVWSVKDLQDLEPDYRKPDDVFPSYEKAILSANGKYLAIYSYYPGDVRLYVLDLESGSIVIAPPFRVVNMAWSK